MRTRTSSKPKQAAAMQIIVEQLAKQRGIMIYETGAHFKIHNEGYMPLSVENIGNEQIAVGHTFVQNGDLMYDPEIVFSIVENIWFPVQTTMHPYWNRFDYCFFERKDGEFTRRYTWNKRWQHDAADFANEWAANLKAQGFLEAGINVSICVWNDPTTLIQVNQELLERCCKVLDKAWLSGVRGWIERVKLIRALPGQMNVRTAMSVYDYWMMGGQ